MTKKLIKRSFPLLAILLLLPGPIAYAHAEKVDVLISFTERPGPTEQALIHNAGGKVKRNYHIVPTIAASIPKGRLNSLRNNPKVASVEEDITVQIIDETLPWGVDRIDAEVVCSQNKGRQNWARGVKVAILDTGIDLDHPDLRVARNVSFVDGTVNGDDDHGHGTMVAGVVAGLANDIGVVGVAPDVQLYAVKVLNRWGWGTCSDILSGIEWAIDNRVQVVNMSFGGVFELPLAIQTALQEAYQAGIVLIAGAGNAGDRGIIFSPARYKPVIAVGATDKQDARASFSCTGATLELVAPGVGVLSTSRGGYSSGSGTSLSAPHVTGVAALLMASGVTNNIEVRQILQRTAEDLGPAGWDRWYGCGLVNASEAVNDVDNNEPGDKIPPFTSIEINGLQDSGGWYRSDVRVELTAVDNPGGSGVAETQYSLDGGKTWQSYQEPPNIVNEGVTTIHARSRDNAGNVEIPPAYIQVKIDKTGPIVSISVEPSLIEPAKHKKVMVDVLVTVSANDGLSGLYSFLLVVKDEYGQIEQTERVFGSYLQRKIQLEAWRKGNDLDGRVYSIAAQATDDAGNTGMARTKVIVSHDRRKD